MLEKVRMAPEAILPNSAALPREPHAHARVALFAHATTIPADDLLVRSSVAVPHKGLRSDSWPRLLRRSCWRCCSSDLLRARRAETCTPQELPDHVCALVSALVGGLLFARLAALGARQGLRVHQARGDDVTRDARSPHAGSQHSVSASQCWTVVATAEGHLWPDCVPRLRLRLHPLSTLQGATVDVFGKARYVRRPLQTGTGTHARDTWYSDQVTDRNVVCAAATSSGKSAPHLPREPWGVAYASYKREGGWGRAASLLAGRKRR